MTRANPPQRAVRPNFTCRAVLPLLTRTIRIHAALAWGGVTYVIVTCTDPIWALATGIQ